MKKKNALFKLVLWFLNKEGGEKLMVVEELVFGDSENGIFLGISLFSVSQIFACWLIYSIRRLYFWIIT